MLIFIRGAVVQHPGEARVLPLCRLRRCRNEAAVQRVGQLQGPGPLQLGKGAQGVQEGGPLCPLLLCPLCMLRAAGRERGIVAQLLRQLWWARNEGRWRVRKCRGLEATAAAALPTNQALPTPMCAPLPHPPQPHIADELPHSGGHARVAACAERLQIWRGVG